MGRIGIAAVLASLTLAVVPAARAGAAGQPHGRSASVSTGYGRGWHELDYPGAAQTWLFAVSPSGAMFGQYEAKSGALRGLELDAGKWRTVGDPAAGTGGQSLTEGETSAGAIVGDYVTAAGVNYGFVDSSGHFATVADPRASTGRGQGTVVAGVNPSGELVGYYFDARGAHGFTDVHGRFTTLDYVGPKGTKTYYTLPAAVSSNGTVVGYEYSSAGAEGFSWRTGRFTVRRDPVQPKAGATQLVGVAPASGEVVGDWWKDLETGGHPYGFVLQHGRFSALDDPHGALGTSPQGVTDAGTVDGYFTDARNVSHGFVFVP